MSSFLKYWPFLTAVLLVTVTQQLQAQVAGTDSLGIKEKQRIHDTYNNLLENNRFIEFLDLTTVVDFPVGIKKTIGNIEYVIAIDSIVITPTFAYLNASMSFTPLEGQERLAFRGTNIRFTEQGGISGDARLELVGDHTINIPGDKISLTLIGDSTYVEWDCDGFKQFGIAGGVTFSREIMLPLDFMDKPTEGEVQAAFSLSLRDWNDLVAVIDISPFQITGLNGFKFNVEEALFDFSDLRNPTGIIFPQGYRSPYFLPGNDNLWRGIYIKTISVSLPPQFKQEDDKIPQIKGTNLLIDNSGVSGYLEAHYLLSLSEGSSGSMQGWPFSIDEIGLSLTSNKLNYSFIDGELLLPITDENTKFEYDAFIDHENNYFFNISPTDSINFELWKAGEVKLYESSYISVEVIDGQFSPSANLNGIMNLEAPIGGTEKVELADIRFENLLIKSKAPFISGGIFSTGSETSTPKLTGFSLDIEKLAIKSLPDSTISLDIETGITLNGNKGGDFSASGGISIISDMSSRNSRQKWNFNRVQVNSASINVDNDAFKFAGTLNFYTEHNVFGNGFKGNVLAEFQPGIKVEAVAQFGSVKGMKYWYADALAEFPKAIPVAPGFGIYGFGGGASYHMRKVTNYPAGGMTRSGIDYMPDGSAGLGLRAALSVGTTTSPEAFNGEATFEIAFYNSGGIRNINFKGEGYFMTLPINGNLEKLKSNIEKASQYTSNNEQPEDLFKPAYGSAHQRGEVSGHININYDFTNRTLHGNLEVFVNAAEGMVKGVGYNGRAGWAVLHFAPDDWYIHIGTPTSRIGLKMGIGDVNAQADGYFMVGTKIPSSPPPDENVSRILGGIDLDYMRDENALGMGTGFAMGAALGFNTGNLTFWKFYARFMAGAGFDIMLKNYGAEASCAGRQGPIGINGWYANGQAYAFFDGKIGIIVDVFGSNREIDIINLAAAAVLQAKLPNPVWMRGVVGGYFNALGGLVKGDCRFEVVIGEECDIQGGSAVSGIKVIADITPTIGEKDVSVFNNPQAVFNMSIGEVFELVDVDNTRKSFRIKLDHFRTRKGQTPIDGEIIWNGNSDVAILNAFEILPPQSDIKVEVQISFEEKVGGNWIPVTSNGNIIIERQEALFTTGTAPDYIPLNNVAYSYPLVEMTNYYSNESSNGYIQLKKGQSYLFESDENWRQSGIISSENSNYDFDFNYSIDQKRVLYDIPGIKSNQVFLLQLVKMPNTDAKEIDRNVTSSTTSLNGLSGDSEIKLETKKAEGSIDELKETIVFSTKFRSSSFDTFNDKMASIDVGRTIRVLVVEWDQHLLQSQLSSSEHFGFAELEGSQYTEFEPLIKMEAELIGNSYYRNNIYPMIYNNYPIDGIGVIDTREVEVMGVPPVRAIEIDYSESPGFSDFQTNISLVSAGRTYLIYDLPRYYRRDYYNIREKVVPLYLNHPVPLPSQINALMFHSFPFVNEGDYKVRFNYYLPGESKPNSSYEVNTILDFSK